MKSLLLILLIPTLSFAKLHIVTTTANLAAITQEIAGENAEVLSLTKGVQDPHFLEAKPSYIVKLSKADLLISVGLSLEVGWLPLIIRGARNPDLREGGSQHLVVSHFVDLLEVETEQVSRADGDVHPEGNPHFTLSPTQALKVALAIKEKLISIDKKHTDSYEKQFNIFKSKIETLITELKKSIKPNQKVITYHKTLTYFYHEFGITNVAILEPKPGIPPTASHIIQILKIIKENDVRHILIENYFDETVGKKIKTTYPDIHIHQVPVAVKGDENIKNIFDLYRNLAKMID